MDRSEIAAEIKAFLEREMPRQGAELTNKTNLLEEWFFDSMQVVEMVMFIESSFGIEVYRADINGVNFKDIETISNLVAKRL